MMILRCGHKGATLTVAGGGEDAAGQCDAV
jgi:hypothetical protein